MKTKKSINRSYSELIKIKTFKERLAYLSLSGMVGEETFGSHRYLNQRFYQSLEWKRTRNEVILRDNGFDLAHEDHPLFETIYIHHINPITMDDILKERPCVFDLNNLVCTSFKTHNAIHYGVEDILFIGFAERKKNDTCPWRL